MKIELQITSILRIRAVINIFYKILIMLNSYKNICVYDLVNFLYR